MTSKIVVNNIQADAGVSTVTFASNIQGNLTGNVTGTVNSSGIATFSSGLVVSAGTTSAPSISPTGDSNTGIFFPSADTVCIGEGGTEVVRIHNLGRVLVGTANTDIAGAPSNKGAKQFIYTADGNGEWALQARNDSPTGNGFFLRAGNSSTTYTARFTGYDENNVHLNVDGLGRVTTPLQPAFHVPKTTGDTLGTSASKLTFGTATYDVGSNYSDANDRFTAPVAGKYFFYCSINVLNSGNFSYIQIRKNGNLYGQIFFAAGNYPRMDFNPSGIIDLAVSDYVEVWGLVNTGTITVDNAGYFGGYLLG
jgi:hypothetical protein